MIAETEISNQSSVLIAGISVRTSNQNGKSQKDIGELWTRLMVENLAEKTSNQISDDIYCVYTDYESDHTGSYTAVLGYRVSTLNDLPDGFTGLSVPEGKYKIYYLEGKFPDNVGKAWQEIWESRIERIYRADYDLYQAGALSFEETKAQIYLGIR
ncbi:MAG TPA: effector binding domain-containing protein [Mucilaginibacter sp.]|nr:effector binding domain-containing protein [Mucilaginibacter sp.]